MSHCSCVSHPTTAAASCPRRPRPHFALGLTQCGSRHFNGNIGGKPETTVVLAGRPERDWPQRNWLDRPGHNMSLVPETCEFHLLLLMAAEPQLCSVVACSQTIRSTRPPQPATLCSRRANFTGIPGSSNSHSAAFLAAGSCMGGFRTPAHACYAFSLDALSSGPAEHGLPPTTRGNRHDATARQGI
jgi:hypothetical protein